MDTELFTFSRALNAWVLLSPSSIDDPLGFIDQINDWPERCYHSATIEGESCLFGNYCTGETLSRPLEAIEAEQIHTPRIDVGDILILDPGRFHRTNTAAPKHALALKFVLRGPEGFLSSQRVDTSFWPEVGLFTELVKRSARWDDVITGIKRAFRTEEGRKALTSGFYPEQFRVYQQMVASL